MWPRSIAVLKPCLRAVIGEEFVKGNTIDAKAGLTGAISRRGSLRALGSSGLAALIGARLGVFGAGAKTKRKRKPKKAKRNAFGCLNVGQPCNGDSGACCSGICEGTKPKKGQKDSSRRVSHDAVTCQAGEREPYRGGAELVLCTTSTGFAGQCNTTTGNGRSAEARAPRPDASWSRDGAHLSS